MAGYIGEQPITKATYDTKVYSNVETDTFNFSYNPYFLEVYKNGIKLVKGEDYTADNGTSIVLAGVTDLTDTVEFVLINTFNPVDTYTKGEVDGLDAENVKLSGDQSIDGNKEFLNPVVVPNGESAGEAVNFSQVIGVGQTWQDVTASRAAGVTYTNSTGKPILLNYQLWPNSASSDMYLRVNSVDVARVASAAYNAERVMLTAIVPNGASYRYGSYVNGLAMNLSTLMELR